MSLPKEKIYTTEDIYALPDGERAELIDGQIYDKYSPSRMHQMILGELFTIIQNYIKSKGGSCEPYIAPFAVFLNGDDRNYVEPDISVENTNLNDDNFAVYGYDTPLTEAVDYLTKKAEPKESKLAKEQKDETEKAR